MATLKIKNELGEWVEILAIRGAKGDKGDDGATYVHPTTHPPSIIAQDSSNRFVTDAEKTTWNGKATVVEYTGELSTTWSGSSAPFSQAVTVTGIASTDKPFIDVTMGGTYATDELRDIEWGYLYRFETSANTITFYAKTKPTVVLPFKATVVK